MPFCGRFWTSVVHVLKQSPKGLIMFQKECYTRLVDVVTSERGFSRCYKVFAVVYNSDCELMVMINGALE